MDKINPLVIPSNSDPSNESPEQGGTARPKAGSALVTYRVAGQMKTATDYFINSMNVPGDRTAFHAGTMRSQLAKHHQVAEDDIELKGHWGELHALERDNTEKG